MPQGRKRSPLDWLLLCAALATVALLWLANIEGFTFGNDPNFNLGTGFATEAKDPFLARFEAAAVANCPPEDQRWCPKYQQLIHSNLYFNYPLYAAYGRAIRIDAAGPFAAAADGAAMRAVATGFAIAACIFLIAGAALPPALRRGLPLILICGAVVSLFGRPIDVRQLDIITSITWPRLAVIAGALAGAALLAAMPPVRRLGESVRDALAALPVARLATLAGLILAALLAARLLAPLPPLVLLLGLILFAALFAAAAIDAGLDKITALSLAPVIFLLIGPSHFFTLLPHTAPRANIFLIAAPLLAYVALRPNGRLVLLLPIFALLHISVAGLIAAALFAVELVVCIIRRRPTLLLAMSAIIAIAARLHTTGHFNAFGAGTDLATLGATVANSDRALPGLLFALMLGLAGLRLALRAEVRWQAAARAILLAALLASIAQIPPILDLAGYDFFDPGLTVIMLAPAYLAPNLAVSLPLVMLSALAGDDGSGESKPRAAILGAAALAALAIVRTEGHGLTPVDWARTLQRGAAQLASLHGDPDPRRDPLFVRLRAEDDRYFLRSAVVPMNDPILYLSLLKYKVRSAAGLFDPARAVIETVDGSLPENRPERSTP